MDTGDVKEAFQGKRGKILIAGGGAAIILYLYWTRVRHGAGAAATSSATPAAPSSAAPAGGDFMGAGGGGDVGSILSPPPVGAGRPSSNGQWLAQCVNILSAPPYNMDPLVVTNALTQALAGMQITTAQAAIVSQALRVNGSPPEGMPPVVSAPPGGPTPVPVPVPVPTPVPTPTPTPTPVPRGTYTIRSGDTLTAIANHYGVSEAALYKLNAATIENAAHAHGRSSSRGPDGSLGWWIYPGTVLVIPPK